MKIQQLNKDEVPYDLIYLADEDDDQIGKYFSKALFWGAWEDSRIVGELALVDLDGERAEIVNVAVYPEYENRKIGTRLVERATAYCKEKGYKEILIKTGNCGIKQIQLYQRCGFRLHSVNRDYMIENYSEPIYEHSIRCRDQVVLNYTIYSGDELQQAHTSYWEDFVKANPRYKGRAHEAWSFGIGDSMADQLIGLVQMGQKTATCSARLMYEEGEKLPEAGDLSILLYGNGMPGCIIETLEIRHKKFSEITAEEARLEGEGDLSLQYWRDGHRFFFGLEYEEKGMDFHEDIPVIFEIFKVIYNQTY